MQPSPTISVVIPMYNAARYIGEAIESILAQTLPVTEIIAVDDGSIDATVALAAKYAPLVRVLPSAHAGASSARNLGVDAAHGEFLAFLDADDLWTPEKLALQMGYWQAHPEVDILFGWAEQFVSPELPASERARPEFSEGPMPAQLPGAMLTTVRTWRRVGCFDPRLEVGDVVDWLARAVEAGVQIDMLDATVLLRRIHLDNMTRRLRADHRAYARVLKAALDRRRMQPAARAQESAQESAAL